jgi:2-amino-4-hydroxy-6-hydroxymethyldihydropteridine diphosphokinase
MSILAYIGIGSNLASPLKNCQRSITLLAKHPNIEVVSHSSFYETEPVGPKDQGWFVNAVAEIRTDLPPLPLLDALLAIEIEMGRIRKMKWGPRIIDLDILLYDNLTIKNDRLEIPHPEMSQRRFVLAPLAELAPDSVHPTANKTIQQLLSELPKDKKVVPL